MSLVVIFKLEHICVEFNILFYFFDFFLGFLDNFRYSDNFIMAIRIIWLLLDILGNLNIKQM